MIWTAGIVIGAIFGAVLALRRGGRKLDALHYAGTFAVVFFLIGLIISVVLDRMG